MSTSGAFMFFYIVLLCERTSSLNCPESGNTVKFFSYTRPVSWTLGYVPISLRQTRRLLENWQGLLVPSELTVIKIKGRPKCIVNQKMGVYQSKLLL